MDIRQYVYPVFIPIVVLFFIQGIKLFIDVMKTKKFDWHNLFTTWWFPSVHSGVSSSLATMVGLMEWLDSIAFMISFVFLFLISFDAMNLRYETGRHAHYLNSMRSELKNILQQNDNYILKERIGHTPVEVVWWLIIWCIATVLLYYLVYIW